MVDYTNLYIKNLDLNVKSADLFDNFRKFGRIISARVMKNAQTKQSKGFGFVSFSKADEAQKARADMNGEYILSKPVIVAFHEPKKPREANGNASPTDSSFNSQQHTKQQQQNNQQHHQNQPQNQYQQQHHQQQQQPQQQQQQQQQQQNHHQQNNQQQNHHHQQQQNNQHHHHHQQYQQNNQQHQHQHQHQQQQQQQQQQNNQHHFSPPRASVLPFNPLPNNSFGDPQTQPQQQNGYHSQANRPRDFNEHRYSLSSKPTYGQSQEYPKTYQTMERNDSRHSGYDYRTQSYVSPVKEQQHHTPLKRDLSGSGSIQPSLIGLASGAFINTPPTYYPPTTQVRPSFRRRGSVESLASVMTETSSHSRRQTVTKAVLAIEKSDDPHVHDIVDMILTLKKKDLATCLFNKVFLKAKIRQAKYALDIFQEELEEEKMGSIQYQEQQQQQQQQKKEEQVVPPAPPPPPRYQSVNALVSLPPRSSRAIPIVAPPPVVTSSSSSSLSPPSAILPPASTPSRETQQNTSHGLNDKELGEEIERFLNSLNGLELHEKKQLLGDRLFPLVKSTGVKQAPKITIKLLDSVPLDELAYSMYDKDKLKQQVSRIVTTLSSRY
ncbi:hypothetical protein BD770DRAFT_1522 [Pilaira anomala]|nr:hypothetical protein BD770DRAFT_1522 [Pilaira anomala]